MSKCCKPVPPEPIVGFVTQGRGVAIHRQDCPNVRRLNDDKRQRLLAADWGDALGSVFDTEIEIDANDRQGLLRDISDVFTRDKINVIAANTQSRGLKARMRFTLQVTDVGQLGRALGLVREVPGVSAARRL